MIIVRASHLFYLIVAMIFRKLQEKLENKMDEDEEEGDDDEEKAPRWKSERQIELEQGDDYILDLKKKYLIPDDQKYDIIPETWEGHNIADFIDPDIMEKLDALEKEEEEREKAGFYDSEESEEDESYAEIKELAGKIRYKKACMKEEQIIDNTTKSVMPRNTLAKKRERSVSRLKREFEDLGVDMKDTKGAHFTRTNERSASRKRLKVDDGSSRRARSSSRMPRDQSGVKDAVQVKKIKKIQNKTREKNFSMHGKAGESDRAIKCKMPKHLFAGKRGNGKTDRR